MPELRWTLLILGVVFIVALAWWERRRPHQASRQTPHIGGESRTSINSDASWGLESESGSGLQPRSMREPTITLPEIRTREPPPLQPREVPVVARELPVVEIAEDASFVGLRVESGLKVAPLSPRAESAAGDFLQSDKSDRVKDERVKVKDEDEVEELEASEAEPVEEPSIIPIPPASAAAGPQRAPELLSSMLAATPPIVDWPPEEARKLVALRLVAPPPERFQGRYLRQALASEGFVLGKLDIFHKPDAANRAVLSAASLTKPGTFDLETMDMQRFVGVNLFAVLPGPKSPRKAFEDLLVTARALNERLQGALQDERGGPLTPTRIAAIRDGLGAEAES